MLFLESTKESNRNAGLMRRDALTVCYQSSAGSRQESEITAAVISFSTAPLVLSECEWENFLRDLDISDSLSNSLEKAIVLYLIDVPEVVEVYFAQQGDTIDVWTILFVNSKEIRRKVYAKELEIVKNIPGYVINFRISGREGAGTPASALYRRIDIVGMRQSNA
ncbi:MAG: hypothetical protein HYZ90_00440 [Candidatus Omnitrophica bacterium]|nr:hypothetical protein [Candidatus Omnitrophota bacterium]